MTYLGWLLVYFAVGLCIASYSGTHVYFFMFFWPWAIAAQVVYKIKGEYPKWTSPL